jgi:AraC-like DNA-binding protein
MTYNMVKTVSAVAVVDLANELINRGLLSVAQLKAVGSDVFTEYTLFKQGESIAEHRLDEARLISLWRWVDEHSSFAFEVGSTVNKQAKGLLANWISYSDTLAQAFNIFRQNVSLLNHAEYWQLFEEDYSDTVVLEFRHQSEWVYPDPAIERSMVAIIAWANYFVARPLQIKSVSFIYPRPGHYSKYKNLFGDDIEFESSANRIVLKKDQFYQVLDTANPYLRDVLKERSERVKLSIVTLTSTVARVKAMFIKDLALYSNIENAIGVLHMSRATIYRKLKDEGETFSDLLKQARLDKIIELKDPLKKLGSDEISELLGFSDVSSYYRLQASSNLSRTGD